MLVAGLGGGLDVVNASLLYFLALENQKKRGANAQDDEAPISLGSARSLPLEAIERRKQDFGAQGCLVDANSVFHVDKGKRYAERRVAKEIEKPVAYFTRQTQAWRDEHKGEDFHKVFACDGLVHSLQQGRDTMGWHHMVFVDGGGDSLVLRAEDCTAGSEVFDPFEGGDAHMLKALHCLVNHDKSATPTTSTTSETTDTATSTSQPLLSSDGESTGVSPRLVVLAVIAVGLDVDVQSFHRNLEALADRGSYYGYYDFHDMEPHFRTDHPHVEELVRIFGFEDKSTVQAAKDAYLALASRVLVLEDAHVLCETTTTAAPEDESADKRFASHTGTVTYRALSKDFRKVRTFVPWQAKGGVEVKPDHCRMFFVDAAAVEQLKLDWANRP